MAARNLRAVEPGEAPARKGGTRRLTVEQAAASGSHRDLLVAMRERIAKTVSDAKCPPRDLAALTRRLQDIAREIESLDAAAEQEAAESDAPDDEAFDASAI